MNEAVRTTASEAVAEKGAGNEPLARLEEITKVYRTGEVETVALDGVSLTIDEGEFVAVMGPSGCGKSTLLNILGMLDAPSAGHYWFRGQDIAGWPERRLAKLRKGHVGFIFQSFNLIDELTVFENIELALLYLGMSKKERRERVEAVMERFGIAHRARHRPSQLSGGQQQRVAVARALVAEPLLVLADEPTANLDSETGAALLDLMRRLNERKGVTFVFSTHDPMVMARARRVVRLKDGRVVA